MRITTGSVGIGTTTPTDSLTVNGSLRIDSTTLYVDPSTNRVGIGTASPSESLHVNGTVRIADTLVVGDTMLTVGDTSVSVGGKMFVKGHPVMHMITGTYTGDGLDNRSINIGADLLNAAYAKVEIFGSSAAQDLTIKTKNIAGDSAKSGPGALTVDLIQAFEGTGFQVGTNSNVNQSAETYYYTAFWAY